MGRLEHLDNIGDEIAQVRAWQGRRSAVQARVNSFRDEDAARLSSLAHYHPMTPIGLLEGFAREGMGPDHPVVQSLTAMQYQYNAANGGGASTRGAMTDARYAARQDQMTTSAEPQEGMPYVPSVVNTPAFNSASLPHRLLLLEQARIRDRKPLSYEQSLRRKGFLDGDGNLVEPVRPTGYKDGNPTFDSREDEVKYREFRELLGSIGNAQGSMEPIPFISATERKPGLYHPRTGHSEVDNGRNAFDPDIPGPLDEVFDRGKQTVQDWISNRRTPTIPGAPTYARTSGFTGGGRTIQDSVRELGIVANAPIQEAYGQVRNVYDATHGGSPDWMESQSDLGVILGSGDGNMSAGDGFFVSEESRVAQERMRREAERGQIGQHSITPGRWVADAVSLSVDTKPFDLVSGGIDLAAQVFGDPTNLVAGGIADASAARRLFEPEEVTGLFSGVRRQFHGPTWEAYRQGTRGQKVNDAIVLASGDNSSPYDIWVAMGRKHDPELSARLYDADDSDKVDEVFHDIIGKQVKSPHELDMLPYHLDPESLDRFNPKYTSRARLEGMAPSMLPAYSIDPTNKLDAATNMEDWLRLGKVPEPVIKDVFNRIARSETVNGVEQALEHAMSAEVGVIRTLRPDVSPQKARELTRLFAKGRRDALAALGDEIGADTPTRDLLLENGIAVQNLDPQLTIEYLQNRVPLPDIDRLRRVLADPKYRWLLTSASADEIGKPRMPEAALNFVMEEVWKPGMLLGRFPAWITRVISEEQLRMAQAGMDGIFNHPLSAAAIMFGKKVKSTPGGNAFDDLLEHEQALTTTHGGAIRRPGATRSGPTHFDKTNLDQYDDYLRAFADNVGKLNYDPVSRQLLTTDVDQTVKWLKGEGRKFLRQLREAKPGKFTTDAQIKTYLTDTLGDRVRVITNDNADLLDAIRTGELNGIPMFRKGGPSLNPKFVRAMESYLDDGPRLIKGFEMMPKSAKGKYDAALDAMFSATMSKATNMASRSPFFKQSMWQQTADLMPYVDGVTRAAVLKNAEDANLSRSLMRQLTRKANLKGDVKITSVDELETLAAGYALEATKKTLYDLSKRGQLAESLKILTPFGNAWQEMVTTWPTLLAGEKYGWVGKFASVAKASRRVQQTVEGGRRNGWFMKNQFGEEVFVFPFSEAYTRAISGVPVPMTGRVQGLSMAFEVFPGMGPVAAVPVSWMLDGKPGTWQEVYDKILPYGAPGERDPNQAVSLLSLAPSWMQKMALAMSAGPPPGIDKIPGIKHIWPTKDEVLWDNNAYMNTQKDVMKYLLSTGDYDPSTREGMLELQEAAKNSSTDLYYIRAAMQFFAPTAPAYEFLVEDKSGRTIAQHVVTEEFYNNLDSGMDFDEASADMMEKYGLDILSLTVPKTQGATYAVPRSREGGDWVNANPDIRTKFPGVYGLFAPQSDEFDYSVLVDQFASGQVDVLTPSEWLNLRNEMMQTLEYNYYRDQVGASPNDEEEAWLRGIRSELSEAYPSSTAGLLEKPKHEELITELYDAVEDPKLRDTELGTALQEYFHYRDQAMAFAVDEAGYAGFANPEPLYPTREWLSGIAKDILRDYPAFETAWTNVLSREFEKELR